jgi:hypothetical protein
MIGTYCGKLSNIPTKSVSFLIQKSALLKYNKINKKNVANVFYSSPGSGNAKNT